METQGFETRGVVKVQPSIASLGYHLASLLLSPLGQDITSLLICKGRGHGPHLSIGASQRMCGHVLKPLYVLKFSVSKQVG